LARKTPGKRYPYATTAARPHDHRFCPVVKAIAAEAKAGREAWGTLHPMPPVPTRELAEQARRGLFAARKHGHSVRAEILDYDDAAGGYVVTVQVWTRAAAKQYIANQVATGQPLAYNVMRRDPDDA
jgi:hypothetical protein